MGDSNKKNWMKFGFVKDKFVDFYGKLHDDEE